MDKKAFREEQNYLMTSTEMIAQDATNRVLAGGKIDSQVDKALGPMPVLQSRDSGEVATKTLIWFKTTDRLLLYAELSNMLTEEQFHHLRTIAKKHPELHWVIVPSDSVPQLLPDKGS